VPGTYTIGIDATPAVRQRAGVGNQGVKRIRDVLERRDHRAAVGVIVAVWPGEPELDARALKRFAIDAGAHDPPQH